MDSVRPEPYRDGDDAPRRPARDPADGADDPAVGADDPAGSAGSAGAGEDPAGRGGDRSARGDDAPGNGSGSKRWADAVVPPWERVAAPVAREAPRAAPPRPESAVEPRDLPPPVSPYASASGDPHEAAPFFREWEADWDDEDDEPWESWAAGPAAGDAAGADDLPAGAAAGGDDLSAGDDGVRGDDRSAGDDDGDGGAPPPAPPTGGAGGRRPPRRRILRLTLAGVLAVVLVACTSAGALLWHGRASLEQTAIEGITPRSGEARSVTLPDGETIEIMNVLIVGTDNPGSLTPEQQQIVAPDADRREGRRPDSIMLAQLQVGGDAAALMSIPRDLRVELCDGSTNRINAAYAVAPRVDKSAESCLVRTITDTTGVEIDHFVEVDFGGFLRVIDALGGVTMYFADPIVDSKAHVSIPAGCVTLTPEQALGFVRSRGYDDDFGRIARQQRFVKEVIEEVARVGTLANPPRLVALVDRAAKSVKTDDQLSIWRMRQLAQGLRNITSSSVIAHTVPADHADIGGVAFVVADDEEAEPLYASFRDGSVLRPVEIEPTPTPTPTPEPTPPSPEQVPPITVLNGTDSAGLAAAAAEMLEARGFRVADTGNADDKPVAATTVIHGTGLEKEAGVLAGVFAGVESAHETGGPPLTLVIGEDLDAAAIEALVPTEPEPEPTDEPEPTVEPTPTPTPTVEAEPERTFRGTERTEGRC